MPFKLGARSLTRLKGVHPDLVKVVTRAIEISTLDFTVLEGLRSLERQQALVEAGASQTLKSRHLTGHAVDLGAWVDGQVDWSWPLYSRIAGAIWGFLVGDAIGVPYEFREPDQIGEVVFGASGTHNQPPGTWSDDSSMTLCTMDAMIHSSPHDLPQHIAQKFMAWYFEGYLTPFGNSFHAFIGTPANSASCDGGGQLGAAVLLEEVAAAFDGDVGSFLRTGHLAPEDGIPAAGRQEGRAGH